MNFIQTNEYLDRGLDLMGIERDAFPDMFTSEVDGEELDVLWGTKISAMGGSKALVFEKTGAEGVRRVAFSDGKIQEVTSDDEYQSLRAGKGDEAVDQKALEGLSEE